VERLVPTSSVPNRIETCKLLLPSSPLVLSVPGVEPHSISTVTSVHSSTGKERSVSKVQNHLPGAASSFSWPGRAAGRARADEWCSNHEVACTHCGVRVRA
jgi:hypothetical protein